MKLKFLTFTLCSLLSFNAASQSIIEHNAGASSTSTELATLENLIDIKPELKVNQIDFDLKGYTTLSTNGDQTLSTLKIPVVKLDPSHDRGGSLLITFSVRKLRTSDTAPHTPIADLQVYANITYPDSFCGNPMYMRRIEAFDLSSNPETLFRPISIGSNNQVTYSFSINTLISDE